MRRLNLGSFAVDIPLRLYSGAEGCVRAVDVVLRRKRRRVAPQLVFPGCTIDHEGLRGFDVVFGGLVREVGRGVFRRHAQARVGAGAAQLLDGRPVALLGLVPQRAADGHHVVVEGDLDRRVEHHGEIGELRARRVGVVEGIGADPQLDVERAAAIVRPAGDRAEGAPGAELLHLGDIVPEEVRRQRRGPQRGQRARELELHCLEYGTGSSRLSSGG